MESENQEYDMIEIIIADITKLEVDAIANAANCSLLGGKFAPIFDNGLSLFNFAMADDFADLETYAKSRLWAFDVPFDEIAKEFVTSRQKGQLRHLQAFKFTRHSRYNLPAARLKALEQFIQKRAGQLLEW